MNMTLDQAQQIVLNVVNEHLKPTRAPVFIFLEPGRIQAQIPPGANAEVVVEAWQIITATLKARNGHMPIPMGRRQVRKSQPGTGKSENART